MCKYRVKLTDLDDGRCADPGSSLLTAGSLILTRFFKFWFRCGTGTYRALELEARDGRDRCGVTEYSLKVDWYGSP